MSSVYSAVQTATSAISGGIIAAIVVGSVVGLALLIGFIICIYCLCCRKPKTRPATVVQGQSYQGNYNQAPPYPAPAYTSQMVNKV